MKYLMCRLLKPTPWNHYLTNGLLWNIIVRNDMLLLFLPLGLLTAQLESYLRRHTVKHRQKTLCLPATLRCIIPHWYCNLHILSVFLSCLAHAVTIFNVNTCWSEVCYYILIRFSIKKSYCRIQAICRDHNTTWQPHSNVPKALNKP